MSKRKITLYRDVVTADGADVPAQIEIREERGVRGKTYLTFRVSVTYALRITPEQSSEEIFEEFKDYASLEIMGGAREADGIAEIDEWLANYRVTKTDAA